MNPLLKNISISNFRSINGTVTVPLDAPIVLIHGPNGSGKTSVLSAIELALTGEILAMQRSDKEYRSHLVYRGADQSRILIDGLDLSDGPVRMPHETIVNAAGISGRALLSENLGRFFSERCYLAQATLGRLLEIYQNASPREESALTQFVKDLLGLDALDALIDGLHPAADLRNTRNLAPAFADAEATIKTIASGIAAKTSKLEDTLSEVTSRRSAVRAALTGLSAQPELESDTIIPEDAAAILGTDDDERLLVALANLRRDLVSLQKRAAPLSTSPSAQDEAAAVKAEQEARLAADKWRTSTGTVIDSLIAQLRDVAFPDLPSISSTDPRTAFQTAAARVEAELQRCNRVIAADDALLRQIENLTQVRERCRARIAIADEQLAQIAGDAEGLGKALASLIPHVHGEVCPVCSRDFAEVSQEPLLQHLSAQVARLSEQADKLQGLGQSRAASLSELTDAERELETAIGKRIDQEVRGSTKLRVATLAEVKRKLADVSASVDAGAAAIRREAETQQRLSEIRSRDRLATELRLAITELCRALEQTELETSETIDSAIQRLSGIVKNRETAANDRALRRRNALKDYNLLKEREEDVTTLRSSLASDQASKKRWDESFAISDKNRLAARAIAKATASVRTAIVGRVFNSSLNKVWRDLFVRLAPTEPFVPAFRLPQTTSEPVTAQLETVHREGGTGGAPGSMLSAGNLNTAALTLFLALHLSVSPQLRWLILDDPVQSMDEVHIAQFAALLRTLSKEHHRRVVIAVHERPLFEYLALELSPAFDGDQLITVELSRSNAGASIAEPTYHKWEPDRAVSVA